MTRAEKTDAAIFPWRSNGAKLYPFPDEIPLQVLLDPRTELIKIVHGLCEHG